jgi:hypothetical protein
MKKILIILIAICLQYASYGTGFSFSSAISKNKGKKGAAYTTSGGNFGAFSWLSGSNYNSNVRASFVLMGDIARNYNITNNIAIYAGLSIRNLGFADRDSGKVFRARNNYLGVPIGIRIGNLKNKTELMLGGGMDYALHYKSKVWIEGDKSDTKDKYCKYGEKTVTKWNPYITAALTYKGYGFYYFRYLSNFYTNGNGLNINGNLRNGNLQGLGLYITASTDNDSNFRKVRKKKSKTINNI